MKQSESTSSNNKSVSKGQDQMESNTCSWWSLGNSWDKNSWDKISDPSLTQVHVEKVQFKNGVEPEMATHDLSPMNFEVIWHVLGFLSGILRLHALIALLAPFPKWMKLFHFILGPAMTNTKHEMLTMF